MIFRELQKAVAAVPNADAYFTADPACVIYWMGQKEEETGKPLDTSKAMDAALSSVDPETGLQNCSGAVGLVLEPEISPVDNVFGSAAINLFFFENVARNRGEGGFGKNAYDMAAKAWALILSETFEPWSPPIFEGLTQVDVSDEGIEGWMLSFRFTTFIEIIQTALADELGILIGDESGNAILGTPDPA